MKKDPIKLIIECERCKTKFEIWLASSELDAETEARIRAQFNKHCPVCQALKNK